MHNEDVPLGSNVKPILVQSQISGILAVTAQLTYDFVVYTTPDLWMGSQCAPVWEVSFTIWAGFISISNAYKKLIRFRSRSYMGGLYRVRRGKLLRIQEVELSKSLSYHDEFFLSFN